MKQYLPRLEAAMVTKTQEINEFVVDQIRDIGMCSKIACVACLRSEICHSIVTRGSVSLSCATTPHPSRFFKS